MPKNNIIRSLALMLLLLSLVLGVIHLFLLRFRTGDVYPAYSSLRSDPLGSRALYESLKNFDEIAVSRNYHPLRSLQFEPETTFLYLGAPEIDDDWVPEEFITAFDRLTQSGGRLVWSFLPINKTCAKKTKQTCVQKKGAVKDMPADTESRDPKQTGENRAPVPEKKECGSQKQKDLNPAKTPTKNTMISLKKHWGVGFEVNENLTTTDDNRLALVATALRSNLPGAISWHSTLYFDLLDSTWRILYSCQGHPVMVERRFGKGSIVLCADTYFMSNEALRSERYPPLLVWLIGRNSNIIFDESHFGIYRQPSVAGLIRHYRFHWFFVSLAVMALLFVWKNAVYFVPPRQDAVATGVDVVSEKDYTQGLVALLRRNIAPGKILQVCAREWEQTFKRDKRVQSTLFERIRMTAAHSSKKQTDPGQGYRRISRIISEDKGYE